MKGYHVFVHEDGELRIILRDRLICIDDEAADSAAYPKGTDIDYILKVFRMSRYWHEV